MQTIPAETPEQGRFKTTQRGPRVLEGEARDASPHALLLDRVQAQLDAGQHRAACELLRTAGRTPDVRNAYGVCALRNGQVTAAVDMFRAICLVPGTVSIRPEVPVVWKTNFATALALTGNVAGCVNVLNEAAAEEDPHVVRLRLAVRLWERELSLWQWLNWKTGIQPRRPLVLDFPPGDLR